MKKTIIKKCENCGEEIEALNPSVEEYIEHKFCIKLFGWKLMLLKDYIEMGCVNCVIEKKESRQYDYDEKVFEELYKKQIINI